MSYFARGLPPELLHTVFSDLHPAESDWSTSWPKAEESRKDLSACTLVCQSWHAVAFEHLFRDVVFSFRTILNEQDKAIERDSAGGSRWVEASTRQRHFWKYLPSKTLETFLEFLEQSPAIRSSIRRLQLARFPLPWSAYYGKEEWGEVDPALVAALVTSLPRLSSLHTSNVSFAEPRRADHPIPVISVRNLHIDYRIIRTTVYNLLSWFGKVDKLTIGHSQLICGTPRDCPPSVSLDVHSFTISPGLNIPTLFAVSELLSQSPHISNLRRVTLIGAPLSKDPEFQQVINCLGFQLEYLKLVLSYKFELFSNQTFDLSRLSSLEELVIGIRIPLGDSDDRQSFMKHHLRFLRTTVLSPQKNPRLKRLGFCLINAETPYAYPRGMDGGWWEPIRHVIADFETHVAGIVKAFHLDGIHFECHDEYQPPDRDVEPIRRIAPHIFPDLARQDLIILEP